MTKKANICENCGIEFEPRSSTTRFCSRKCYEEHRQANRKTKMIVCPICKNGFLQVRPEQIYCSNECKHKSTENKTECVCEHCGKIFERKRSEVDKNKRHYCSNECRMADMFWSEEDTNILITNFGKLTYKEMSENNMFSTYRSIDEIKRRAIYVGITSSPDWSDEETDILKNNYSKVSMNELLIMLPKRTRASILGKARSYDLKSKYYLSRLYTNDELEYLKNNYLTKSNEELGRELNRTPLGIAQRLLILDLHRPTEIDNYKTLKKYIRCRLTPWRDRVRELNNYTCSLTGVRTNIIVHHIRGFNLLLYEAIKNLDLPIYEDISKYSQSQLDELLNEFLEIQESYHSYICINEDIHIEFHKEYGYGNNTEEQWNEFVNKYYKK